MTVEKDNSTVTISFDPSDNSIEVVVDAPGNEPKKGDANGDGEINVSDIDFIIEILGAEYDATNKDHLKADVNGDKAIDVSDIDFVIENIK